MAPPFLVSLGPEWEDISDPRMKKLLRKYYDRHITWSQLIARVLIFRCSIECTLDEWIDEFKPLPHSYIPPKYKLPRKKFSNPSLSGPSVYSFFLLLTIIVLSPCRGYLRNNGTDPRSQLLLDLYVKDLMEGDLLPSKLSPSNLFIVLIFQGNVTECL